jgi:hypothetical protein
MNDTLAELMHQDQLPAAIVHIRNGLATVEQVSARAADEIRRLESELVEARAALNEVQTWPYSETLEAVRFIWKEKHAAALQAAYRCEGCVL